MRTILMTSAAALMIGAGAAAKPLNRAWVPPSAPWLAHVDLEAAMRSEIGRLGFEGPEPIFAEVASDLEEELGFDLFAEVRSVTIYGLTVEQKDPAVIISTTPAAEAKMNELAAAMSLAGVQERGRTIYTMAPEDGEDSHVGAFIAGADAGERILVIARDSAMLHAALDVVEGKGRLEANLDQSPLSRGPANGSIVFVSASQIDRGLDIQPMSLVLQKAEGVRIDLGESAGSMFLEVDVRTSGDAEAVQIQQMAQGALAMAQFAAGKEPALAEVAALAASMKLAADGRDVALRFRHESKDLIERLTRLQNSAVGEQSGDGDGQDVEVFRRKIKVNKSGAIEE